MKFIFSFLFVASFILHSLSSEGQNILAPLAEGLTQKDTAKVDKKQRYKAAEIAFEIERINRSIKEGEKKIDSYENIAKIDTSFEKLRVQVQHEFDEFDQLNALNNVSRFFLINTKRIWNGYRSQLELWQTDLTNRIESLVAISEKTKKEEKLWEETSKHLNTQAIPDDLNKRISTTINRLEDLETRVFKALEKITILDSKMIDQVIEIDEQIESIELLHRSYRKDLLKATKPVIWKIPMAGSFEGSFSDQLDKAWTENRISLKNSLPSLNTHVKDFIFWSLSIIVFISLLAYFYKNKKLAGKSVNTGDINELIIHKPILAIVYLIIFAFYLLFKNIPMFFSGLLGLSILLITYFLLSPYISRKERGLILVFVPLAILNNFEIFAGFFGNYASIFLGVEAFIGVVLFSFFLRLNVRKEGTNDFRYPWIVYLIRYPVFFMYLTALISDLFGYQNLAVFLLKTTTHVSYAIIVIIGAWEITKSCLFTTFELLTRYDKYKSQEYFPLFKKRILLLISVLFVFISFNTFLSIIEINTVFYDKFEYFTTTERHVGSFAFTWESIIQFLIIMFITWGIVTIIRIAFDEQNFRRTQKLRGIPAAISITLRMVIVFGGFLFALSVAGVDLTKISIMIGAFSVGIGFGLQNIVNNFISGLILIYERPIQVGDTIELNQLLGEVKKIGIRSSKVRTYDGAEVVVPNSNLVSNQLINWTLSDTKRRLDIKIGVKYGTDPELVIEVLKQVAAENELVKKFPEPMVVFNEFSNHSLDFRLLCWVSFEHSFKTKSDLTIAINKAFQENRIEIPFPQLDLHVVNRPSEKQDNS